MDGLDCFDYEILVFRSDSTLIAQKLVAAAFFHTVQFNFVYTQTRATSTHNHIAAYTHMHVSKTEEQIGDKRHTDTRIEICVRVGWLVGT